MKTSSRAGKWWKRWKEIERLGGKITAEDYELMKKLEVEDLRELIQISDEEASPKRRDLLLELANLQDSQAAVDRFTKHFSSVSKLEGRKLKPLELRDELRHLWAEPKLTAAAVQAAAWGENVLPLKQELKRAGNFVSMLFYAPPKESWHWSGWEQIRPLGTIRPDDDNFIGQLAWAIAQNYSRFRICTNPDCPTPYYLWRRFDQQYCSSDLCVRYANRLAANRYWNSKGSQRRAVRRAG